MRRGRPNARSVAQNAEGLRQEARETIDQAIAASEFAYREWRVFGFLLTLASATTICVASVG